ncbi:hypothetical protein [Corallococcus silvisoli]|uniref:hypothetical protein n=1 Tax=Corallococcus silvisoli TaxID=2697031 RepID=UPI0013789793|nr:hypothetical protein [Corallococcus silvisoli]NBD09630.1 hypothetical protein [Corallococcus silvisoli]
MKTTTMVYLGCGAAVLAGAAAWWWSGRSAIPDVPAPTLPTAGAMEVTVTPVALTSKPDLPPVQSALQAQANGIAVVSTGFVPSATTDAQRKALEVAATAATLPPQPMPAVSGVGLSLGKLLGASIQIDAAAHQLPVAPASTTAAVKAEAVNLPIFRRLGLELM